MSISLLLEMAVSADPARTAVVAGDTRLTTHELSAAADGAAGIIVESGCAHVAYVGAGGLMLPVLLFGSAHAGIPFTPLNYRLSAESLRGLIARLPSPLVVVDERYADVIGDCGGPVIHSRALLTAAGNAAGTVECAHDEPDGTAVVLFTSGTTAAPKAVELQHSNLTSYITTTVEFGSADPADTALICVPPYHIAGVGAALSNLYAGRRIVYLPNFDAAEWVRLAVAESVTTATVVPTMLDRIVKVLEDNGESLPALRTLAYGGSKANLPLVRRALDLLPHVGFVNAYGLTETSSTIAVLTPDDHRIAHESTDTATRRRLGSVGKPVPGIEIEIRTPSGSVAAPGETGELFVRGPQVSGRYTGIGSALDEQGWFATRDIAAVDDDGYLYLGGRSDDTIIRGGENIAPAELEDVLAEHPLVHDVAVVGVEHPEWGQAIVAVVVPVPGSDPDPDDIRAHTRRILRGSRTPDEVVFRDELPTNSTGKVLRRELAASLAPTSGVNR